MKHYYGRLGPTAEIAMSLGERPNDVRNHIPMPYHLKPLIWLDNLSSSGRNERTPNHGFHISPWADLGGGLRGNTPIFFGFFFYKKMSFWPFLGCNHIFRTEWWSKVAMRGCTPFPLSKISRSAYALLVLSVAPWSPLLFFRLIPPLNIDDTNCTSEKQVDSLYLFAFVLFTIQN